MRVLKKNRLVIVLSALFLVSTALAAEYFLVTFNMSIQDDAEVAYASAQGFFSQAQSTLNANGNWRPGDIFIVQYNGGVIAKFNLSSRGMTCVASRCTWNTAVPFDDPPTIKQTGFPNNGLSNINVNADQQTSLVSNPQLDDAYVITPSSPDRAGIVVIGPITPVDGGGGSCSSPSCRTEAK